MKVFILYFASVILIPLYLTGQNTYNYPVDVLYDQENQQYYVSNQTADGNGYILTLNAEGQITGTFYTNLNYPGGLLKLGNTLYVLNNSDLVGSGNNLPSYLIGIDINTGLQVSSTEISTNGTYLDFMTYDNNGHIFINDSEKYKIYKYTIAMNSVTDFVTGLNSPPFGVCYDSIDNRILFTSNGNSISYLKSISPDGGAITSVYYTPAYLKGVIMNTNGDFYLSIWDSGGGWGNEPVKKASHALNWDYVLSTDHNRPFGMCIGKDNTLVVCNWGSHSLSFIDLNLYGVPENAGPTASVQVYPNPSDGHFNLKMMDQQNKSIDVLISTISGSVVFHEKIAVTESVFEREINVADLPAGIYIMQVMGDNLNQREKLIIR